MKTVISALINLVRLFLFPGLLYASAIGLLLTGIDRKLYARAQRRIGPPVLQPFYDTLKLFGKEIIIPSKARKTAFLAAPYVAFAAAVSAAAFVPVFGQGNIQGTSDIIVILYLLTLSAAAIILGGSASGSPFAGVGVSRSVTVMLGYELPLVISVAAVMAAGKSFTLSGLSFDVRLIPAMLAMLFVIPAEVGMHPFDAAEAGMEICEGPLVEYTGLPLALMKMTHAVKLYVMTALFIAMFFGGTLTGILVIDAVIFPAVLAVVSIFSVTLMHIACARFKSEQIFRFLWTVPSLLSIISLVLVFTV